MDDFVAKEIAQILLLGRAGTVNSSNGMANSRLLQGTLLAMLFGDARVAALPNSFGTNDPAMRSSSRLFREVGLHGQVFVPKPDIMTNIGSFHSQQCLLL